MPALYWGVQTQGSRSEGKGEEEQGGGPKGGGGEEEQGGENGR